MKKVKVIIKGDGFIPWQMEWDGVLFVKDDTCRDYDWLLVYDEFPKVNTGSIVRQREPLACPKENTILVTSEPPTIKIYTRPYVSQFAYVLSTHLPCYLPHRNRVHAPGCLLWMADYDFSAMRALPEFEKTKLISTVCSAKQQKHTLHNDRYRATRYIAERMPEMDWYGRGVRELAKKYDALSPYKYHLAAENYVGAHHWTDKISDPILGLCLTFYAGDPRLDEEFPAESFIPVPLDDHEATLTIMREAIRNNEYEKRLPALREARRLLVQKYNLFSQVARLVTEESAARQAAGTPEPAAGGCICGRHRLRCNPLNAVEEFAVTMRHKLGFLLNGRGSYAPGKPDRA